MFGGEPDHPVERPGEEFARGHYEQLVEATGTVQVGDDQWELHGFGLRDHSWGPRYWQAPWYYRWLTGNVGDDFGFMGSRIARRDGPGTRGGFVWDGGALQVCHDFRIRTTWEGDARYHRSIEAELVTDDRTWAVHGSVLRLIPLRNRRHRPDGNELVTRISEGLTRVDPRRRARRLRAVGVPRPDRRRVTGRAWPSSRAERTMDRATVDIYEERGRRVGRAPSTGAARRGPGLRRTRPLRRVAHRPGMRGRPLHLGSRGRRSSASTRPGPCSSGAGTAAPAALLVQGDLEALPFGPGTLHGGWAHMSYLHVPERPAAGVPWPICTAPWSWAPRVDIQVLAGDYEGDALPADRIGGRFFAAWTPERSRTSSSGPASTSGTSQSTGTTSGPGPCGPGPCPTSSVRACGCSWSASTPASTPPTSASDTPGPETASGPAALRAGLVTRDRDPAHALRVHGVGMTDLVKRATSNATALRPEEYRAGMARVERLVRWLGPGAVCFVGLTGWRHAVDRHAEAGLQRGTSAVGPSTSCRRRAAPTPTRTSTTLTRHLARRRSLGCGGVTT